MNFKNYKKFIFSLIAILLIFICLEIITKVTLILLKKPSVFKTLIDDPEHSGYDFLTGHYNYPFKKKNIEKNTNFIEQATDRYGFNLDGKRMYDKDLSKKDQCEFRIFLLGGSTVQGRAIKDTNDPISARLESQLKNLNKNISFKVYNAGTSSFFSQQELMLVQNRILYALKPEQIIILNGSNDFIIPIGKDIYLSNSHNYQRYFQNQFIKQDNNFFIYFDTFLSKNLSIYFLTKKIVEKASKIKLFYKDQSILEEISDKTYHQKKVMRYFYNTNILKKLSSNKTNIDIFFQPTMLPENLKNLSEQDIEIFKEHRKLQPEYFQNKEYFYNLIRKKIKDNMIKSNEFFKIHDISDLINNKKMTLPLFSDHVHYNSISRQIIAEKIYVEIKNKVDKKIKTEFNNCF